MEATPPESRNKKTLQKNLRKSNISLKSLEGNTISSSVTTPDLRVNSPSSDRKSSFFGLLKKKQNVSSLKPFSTTQTDESTLSDKQTKKLVLLQSFTRRWILRKRFLSLSPVVKRTAPLRSAVRASLSDLLNKEQKFQRVLETMVQNYYASFSKSKGLTGFSLSTREGEILLFNLEEIYTYHNSHVTRLEKCIGEWPLSPLWMVLDRHARDLSVILDDFPSKIREAEELLEKLSENPLFKLFLSRKASNHSDLENRTSYRKLMRYCIHYMSDYYKHLQKVFFAMSPLHSDRSTGCLFRSVVSFHEIHTGLKENISQVDCKKVTNSISKDTEANVSMPNLDIPGRMFKQKGMAESKEGKRYYMYMLSDLFLVVRKRRKKMQLVCQAPIQDTSVSQILYNPNYKTYTYQLRCGSTKYTFSEKKNSGFVHALRSYIDGYQNHQQVLNSFNCVGVPSLILKCVYHLDKSLFKFGIFRMEGKEAVLNRNFQEELSGEGSDNFRSLPRDYVSSFFLKYLKWLPRNYTIDTDVLLKDLTIGKDGSPPSDAEIYENIPTILKDLCTETLLLLDYITFFLARLCNTHQTSSHELSYHFAFLLTKRNQFCSVSERVRTSPTIAKIFRLFIENKKCFNFNPFGTGLPEKASEFILSDHFGDWWNRFRWLEETLISRVCEKEFLREYFKTISNCRNQDDNFASLSKMILVTEAIGFRLLSDKSSLIEFLKIFADCDMEKSEKSRSHFGDVFVSLFRLDPASISSVIMGIEGLNTRLMSSLGSGSILHSCQTVVIEITPRSTSILPLLSAWCDILTGNIKNTLETQECSDVYPNWCELLGSITQCASYIPSEDARQIIPELEDHFRLLTPIALSLSTKLDLFIPFQAMFICAFTEIPTQRNTLPLESDETSSSQEENDSSVDETIAPEETSESEMFETEKEVSLLEIFKDAVTSPRSLFAVTSYSTMTDEKNMAETVSDIILEYSQEMIDALDIGKGKQVISPLGTMRFQQVQLIAECIRSQGSRNIRKLKNSCLVSYMVDIFFKCDNSVIHSILVTLIKTMSHDAVFLYLFLSTTPLVELFEQARKSKKKRPHWPFLKEIIRTLDDTAEGREAIAKSECHKSSKIFVSPKSIRKFLQ